MAEKKKNIMEEALLDVKIIQETLNANSKEILRSVMNDEIDELVKESLNEDYDEVDVDDEEVETDVPVDGDAEAPVDGIEGDTDNELNIDGDGTEEMGGSEEDLAVPPIGEPAGDDLGMGAVAPMGDEMDMTAATNDEVIAVYKKLTGDDEIQIVSNEAGDIELTVNEPGEFVIKANTPEVEAPAMDMAPEMGIEAPEMGIEAPEVGLEAPVAPEAAPEMGAEVGAEDGIEGLEATDSEEEEETYEESYDMNESQVVYEIAIEEMENIESVTAPVGSEKSPNNFAGDNLEGGFDDKGQNGTGDNHGAHIMEDENAEVTEGEELTETDDVNEDDINEEAIDEKIQVGKGRNVTNNKTEIQGSGGDANKVKAPNVTAPNSTNESLYVSKADYDKLLKEAKKLKSMSGQLTKTLKEQRNILAKVVVFNTNLTNVTRLFTEHTTTKNEKRAIIERFDEQVSDIQESKKLFKTIEKELGNKTPIAESIEERITKEKSSSTSKLNENTAYVDQGTKRIMDLMHRVENQHKY